MNKDKSAATAAKERASRMPPAARRAQLIACGVRVFARFGLGNASHAQIADEAGVATPTVFLYLQNRQAMTDAVLKEVARFLKTMVTDASAGPVHAEAKLLAVMQAFAEAIDTDPDYISVFLNWSTVVNETSWPLYVAFQDEILNLLEAIIERGVERGDLPQTTDSAAGAHLIMGSAHMIAQMKFRRLAQATLDNFLRASLRGALSGVG